MIPASYVKKSIDFNKDFRSILEVLKLVAVSQYHILERRLKTFDQWGEAMEVFFDLIDLSRVRHPFLDPGGKPLAVVAVTSDAGLLGGMNLQVVTAAAELVQQENGRLVVLGERGQACAQDLRIPFAYFPGVVEAERHRQAAQLRNYLSSRILSGELGALKVVYPRALSLVLYRIDVETLLPFTHVSAASAEYAKEQILESTPEEILEYLVYLLLGARFYEIFGWSCLAEQAARFAHLEESSQKILEMNKKLTLQYFRRRHETIDQNMRELFSARSLYAK